MLGLFIHLSPVGHLAQAANQPVSPQQLRDLTVMVFYLVLVLIVFVFGIFAIRRASQRFWSSVSRKRPQPTPTEDIWSMHKVPDVAAGEPLESEDDEDAPWEDIGT